MQRKFWLLNDDHRGTKSGLGRVLTLVQSEENRVYGIAYKISKNVKQTFERLNYREKCGYSIKKLTFFTNDAKAESLNCICYFANEDNPYYKPQKDLNSLAEQIYKSVGPSGTNKEYLYNVCEALRSTARDQSELRADSEIFQLETLVKNLDT